MKYLWLLVLLTLGCEDENPVPKEPKKPPAYQQTTQYRLKDTLKDCEEYSVRLTDMKAEGGEYHHKYKINCGKPDATPDQLLNFASIPTGWVPVDADTFNNHQKDLDRNILSRDSNGEVTKVSQPPGYQYVGDERYGEWKSNDSGQKEWVFIPMFLPMFGSSPIYRNDYDDYRDYRRSGRTYYRSDYETRIRTKYTNRKPSFYEKMEQRKYERSKRKASSATNRAAGTYKKPVYNTTPKTSPPKKPLSFKEKLQKAKATGGSSNISGYGKKSSKKFQTKAKPKKKKPTFTQRLKAKTKAVKKKIKTKVKKYKSKKR